MRLARRLRYCCREMEAHGSIRESKGGWDKNSVRFAHHTIEAQDTHQSRGRIETMKKFFAVVMSAAMVAAFSPLAEAQSTSCPAEVAQAKQMLTQKTSTAAPRSLAGSRMDTQAPRGQDVQAPRGQNTQAPRGQ